jgi:hypothetical protein
MKDRLLAKVNGARYVDFEKRRYWVVEHESKALTSDFRRVSVVESPHKLGQTRRLSLHNSRNGAFLGIAEEAT